MREKASKIRSSITLILIQEGSFDDPRDDARYKPNSKFEDLMSKVDFQA